MLSQLVVTDEMNAQLPRDTVPAVRNRNRQLMVEMIHRPSIARRARTT